MVVGLLILSAAGIEAPKAMPTRSVAVATARR